MEPDVVGFLRTRRGDDALSRLAGLDLGDAATLGHLTRLRSDHPAPIAAGLLEVARLRKAAIGKFADPSALLFDRESLEQSSAEPVAHHRSNRFAEAEVSVVFDLGCGAGSDAMALSRSAPVVGLDRDRSRLMMAEHNVASVGGVFHSVEGLAESPPFDLRGMAVFLDPGRRSGGRRRFDPEVYSPPLPVAVEIARLAEWGAIKVAPGIHHRFIPDDAEAEFVSLRGELKECVLWFGGTRTGVPMRASLVGVGSLTPEQDVPAEVAATPMGFLIEPDPAVIRAGLVQTLAHRIGAVMLDPSIAYLTGDERPESTFGRVYRVESWQPFNLKRLRAHLRALGVGSVTVKKRGSAIDPEDLRHRLKLEGTEHRVVVVTRVRGAQTAIVCQKLEA